jgi:hypothetical protein
VTLRASTILADAWAGWRRDWPVLTAVAGMFVFLPQLALLLLVPDLPAISSVTGTQPNDPSMQAYMAALQEWIGHYGALYLAVIVAGLYGQFALVAVYLAPGRPAVGEALGAALRLFPRLLLAIFPVFALVLARTLLVGPAILAARPIGAVAAIGRSFALTRGRMLLLASIVLGVVLAQYLAELPFVALDQFMAKHAPNPVARVIVDGFAAGIAALGAVAMALVQVAAWRRLAR